MKRFISLILALGLIFSLTIPASAANYPTADTEETVAIGEPPVDDVSYDATVDQYLYDVAAIFDKVEYMTHPKTGERFLVFSLADASRLCYLFNKHPEALRLMNNLRLLEEANDIGQLYESLSWPEAFTIGYAISAETHKLIEEGSLDMSSACDLIKTRPEYSNITQLRQMVDYRLHCMQTYAKDIIAGLKDVMTNDERVNIGSLDNLSVSKTIETAQKYLESHPALTALGDVYEVYVSGPTSKLLATLYGLEQEQVSELYAAVRTATDEIWNEHRQLDRYKFLMPFPEGTIISDRQWPEIIE